MGIAFTGGGLGINYDFKISRNGKLLLRLLSIAPPTPPKDLNTCGIKEVWVYYFNTKRYQALLKYHENRVKLIDPHKTDWFPQKLRYGEPMPFNLVNIWVQTAILRIWRMLK